MSKANEQATTTTKFQGQSKFTTIGGLAESIVENTYNKIEYYGSTKKKAPNFEYMKKKSQNINSIYLHIAELQPFFFALLVCFKCFTNSTYSVYIVLQLEKKKDNQHCKNFKRI